MPLSLSLVGGAESPADAAFNTPVSASDAPAPVITERPRVAASTKAVTSYANERIFVGASGVVYTLSKQGKTLRYEQNQINLPTVSGITSPRRLKRLATRCALTLRSLTVVSLMPMALPTAALR